MHIVIECYDLILNHSNMRIKHMTGDGRLKLHTLRDFGALSNNVLKMREFIALRQSPLTSHPKYELSER